MLKAALICLAGLAAVYAGFVLALLTLGRRSDARALAGFIPDCLILFKRLLGDDRVSPARKLALAAVVAYLALPLDLVPTSCRSRVSWTTRSSSRWRSGWCFALVAARYSMSTGRGRPKALG